MKLWITYSAVFVIGIAAVLLLFNASANPEKAILGKWKETEWKFEKAIAFAADIAAASKTKTTQPEFSFHRAEDWEFLPGGLLRLKIAGKEEHLSWRIKGRGHVLQIQYGDNRIENYQLTVLENNRMVLNAESDMQARGIAQLIFERTKTDTYAQKIQ
ncbi:hypothetical protein IQ13_2670 [Lacibacter cauensis]|uniref:Lipocalin-like protein n=1 Tax=Lacibacter cauensis TaxID=510947 RepID=A0A562SKD7_9BACT|nr:hypothetical protein [Lacibacter cauensis]TWI81652.1 hypothetical protein IQ13_2670 [Lacibacter cauensis]